MDVAPKKETCAVGEAKRRLRAVAGQLDPYAFVRTNPLCSVGAAFLAGLTWGSLRRGKAAASLLPVAVQLAGFVLRQGLAAKSR